MPVLPWGLRTAADTATRLFEGAQPSDSMSDSMRLLQSVLKHVA